MVTSERQPRPDQPRPEPPLIDRRRVLSGVAGTLLLSGCGGGGTDDARTTGPAPDARLRVEVLSERLEHGWDVGFLPDGSALVTQRPGRLAVVDGSGTRTVRANFDDVLVRGEGGLMGLLVDPDFGSNRRFVTCQTHRRAGEATDVRLVDWRLSADGRAAERTGTLLTGLPLNPSGRHSGCRPAWAPDGNLLVTTGDTARPGVAQDLGSLGGKVLRLRPDTAEPVPDNPMIDSPEPATRLVLTFGHRNPQGVAVREDGEVFTAEHGPDVDDELNRLVPGGNYGWDPSRGGRSSYYDESVPMTDRQRFPGAVPAVWTSGDETVAVCDAAFLRGSRWGSLEGVLAVTTLKGSKLLLFRLAADGRSVRRMWAPEELDGTHGRLRAATLGPDDALYLTTSNGSGDRLLRVAPA
ncbi:Glucose/arabinose dehydrogenase, beta-propeller fold [Actinopolyspora xinjiangensis]|uniref:Glucose/arabinose dehydrogenase, beta-propeller fold n=1 Tax=Actinopolyspora xinjiangensis TaxID=405564 RepID=A0A1H0QKJ8_9ACTN|nr:PQQ-dependent sugar dehydrogenase [Actinopolyspora xinjiangensis]SDP17256.1 Glucose/arabinose dehydrogenase, beta-propeller fold [Actinopolyspora xinjiangensis]